MNSNILEGKWKQMRGEVKRWWGKLTDDDLDQINGSREKLLGKLQEKYGYARDKAEKEYERCCREWEKEHEYEKTRP
jgi:uncharacterized protein YjbJ (UPF0337 family)